MQSFEDTDVMISSRDSYFDPEYVFSENLMYSFGITAYDSNAEPIEDPSYGVLKPYYKSWGIKEGGGVDFEELPIRNCTTQELHVGDETDANSDFFIPHPNSQKDLDFYYKKLKCLDVEKINVQGDYNSPKARSFVLLFEKCMNETFDGTCKSDQEIKDWLARKFIIVNMNNQRFNTRKYGFSDKISIESRIEWIPINSQIREELVYKVTLTDLRL